MTTVSQVSGSDAASQSDAFGLLARPVQRWIWEKGWATLRDIQERSIPLLLRGNDDLIVSATTAGGKTEAAFLPLISRILSRERPGKPEGFDLVYVGPLKALIDDQFERLGGLCEQAGIEVHRWHGDVTQGAKARARKSPRGVLLITPESLEAMFVLRGLEVPRLFGRVDAIVVDELHALLDTERGIQLRSLLTRIEAATGRRIRRVGLSATLGDMSLAKAYLRPGAEATVRELTSRSERQEVRLQVRGYTVARPDHDGPADTERPDMPSMAVNREIASHLFEKLRGHRSLVFAGSRQRVEVFADTLRQMCDELGVPNEFHPHHANLSRDHRAMVEERLKSANEPASAICTSTLELGIDIGAVESVAQIGAPFSVASLRQRLGRSGRREGQPAILRMYVAENELTPHSPPADQLRLGLVRAIAITDLLIEGWCEPPKPLALHLSSLLHQVLSVIAEKGGERPKKIYDLLCRNGPFRSVNEATFVRLLRHLGGAETQMIEQSPDGTLLLGRRGEQAVEHHGFYAVFRTPEEYRILAGGRSIGTLPIITPLLPGMAIIFSGKRWRILSVHERDRAVDVVPDPTGVPPKFGGDVGPVHDTVVQRMRQVLMDTGPCAYLDPRALELLDEARSWFRRLGLHETPLLRTGARSYLLACWNGTAKSSALCLALNAEGIPAEVHDCLVEVSCDAETLRTVLGRLAEGGGKTAFEQASLPKIEKFHPDLSADLLAADLASSIIDLDALPGMARMFMETAALQDSG